MSSSYYDILQLKQNATTNDIKKSFRILALKYHPDKNKSKESQEKFLKIVEAYEVLSDENSRRKYDLNLQSAMSSSMHFTTTWIPSADLTKFYSYNEIKNWHLSSKSKGGIWDIGERENVGMWKTTLALFITLASIAIFIVVISS